MHERNATITVYCKIFSFILYFLVSLKLYIYFLELFLLIFYTLSFLEWFVKFYCFIIKMSTFFYNLFFYPSLPLLPFSSSSSSTLLLPLLLLPFSSSSSTLLFFLLFYPSLTSSSSTLLSPLPLLPFSFLFLFYPSLISYLFLSPPVKPQFDPANIRSWYIWPGKTRNLTCLSYAEPMPMIEWIKYKEILKPIYNNRTFRVHLMGKNSNLQVSRIKWKLKQKIRLKTWKIGTNIN